MTPAEIVQRLSAAGFSFTVTQDGDVGYRPPPTTTPESDALLGLIAWNWAVLEPHVA